MEHVGIDLGGRKSQVCVRAPDGTILKEERVDTVQLGDYMAMRPPSCVILETCAEAFAVADAIKQGKSEHDVRIVPATLAPSLGVGARRTKSDLRDARALSQTSTRTELPSVHIKSSLARDHNSLGTLRSALIRARTQLINSVKGWMRQSLWLLPSGATSSFPARLRKALVESPSGAPTFIEPMLVAIDALTTQIDVLDVQTNSVVTRDAACMRLMTAPVGKITALAFRAAIDSAERFDSARRVSAFLGLTPGENSSSERKRTTGITKAGPSYVRGLLIQCCWSMRRYRPDDPLVIWGEKVMARRGKRVGIVAMARRLAGILWAMWRRDANYDPHYATKRLASAPPVAP